MSWPPRGRAARTQSAWGQSRSTGAPPERQPIPPPSIVCDRAHTLLLLFDGAGVAVIATDKREAVELDPLDQVFPNVVLGVSAARKGHDAERVV